MRLRRKTMFSKIRFSSWLLAGAYIALGAVFFEALAESRVVFRGELGPLSVLTTAILQVPPLVWLSLGVLGAAGVILKDLRFRPRLLNTLFLLALVIGYVIIIVAVTSIPPERQRREQVAAA